MDRPFNVGVVGAGIAGLSCAQTLQNNGIDVTILEKSRGIGGRVATRRIDSGASFDHGAQYFTVTDAIFEKQVKQWCHLGAAAIWQARIVSLQDGKIADLKQPKDRFIGVPAMKSLARSLALNLDVRNDVAVQSICRSNGKWQLRDATGTQHGPYDFVILTAPPLQTLTLLGDRSATITGRVSEVRMAPCWAVLCEIGETMSVPYDAAFVHNSALSWIAKNSSKIGRDVSNCWVMHASPVWSQDHLEEPADLIARTLIDEFWKVTLQSARSLNFVVAHRWRYALPIEPLPERFVLDLEANLAVCGDWCGGPRIEGAFLSGHAMAKALLARS